MYAHDIRGVATSSFVCSANGTCSGTTAKTQTQFMDLQKQINRVGISYGISKIDTDGRIGPTTLRVLVSLAGYLSQKLGSNLDRALEDLIIEYGEPTTTRDVASNADVITAALQRDGMGSSPWDVFASVKGVVQQILDAGGAAPTAVNPAAVVNADTSTVPQASAASPVASWSPEMTAAAIASLGPSSTTPATTSAVSAISMPAPWKIGVGIGVAAVLGGIVAAVAHKPRATGVSGSRRARRRRGLGCACSEGT